MLPCSDFLRFLALLLVRAITRKEKLCLLFCLEKSLNLLQQQCQQCCQHRERPRLKFAPTKVIFHICLILNRQRNVLCIKILSNLARRPFQCWNCYHSWARTEQTVHRSCSCRVVSIQLERSAHCSAHAALLLTQTTIENAGYFSAVQNNSISDLVKHNYHTSFFETTKIKVEIICDICQVAF